MGYPANHPPERERLNRAGRGIRAAKVAIDRLRGITIVGPDKPTADTVTVTRVASPARQMA